MPRNQAARAWGQEKCLWNALKNTGLPGFGVSEQGDNPALRGEDGSRRKKATRIKNKRLRITDWMYNNFRQDGKMEILVYGVSNGSSAAGFSRSAPRAGARRTRSQGFAGAARA
ncbi:MAG: hypothetical protein WBL65_12775, partial [Bryobacteraceae bacterium]